MIFKKIGVCHGKVCGPAGAHNILRILKEEYGKDGVEVVERTCCGRCERNNSISIDDMTIISDLSSKNIREKFIADPETAIGKAEEEQSESEKKLDSMVFDDLLL
ncbi:hypothetical protein HYW94_03835 [Candidatus Uhrbacteria bacterium]|nr:hypothetical protein [Candidatus Uhrbacteria bacterium]